MGFYMLRTVLNAYIFHEMDEKFKDIPRTKGDHNEEQWKYSESYISSFGKGVSFIQMVVLKSYLVNMNMDFILMVSISLTYHI